MDHVISLTTRFSREPLSQLSLAISAKFLPISNGSFLAFQGGFARVYLMTDVSNGNQYACKIIPKNRMQKIHMQKVFIKKVRIYFYIFSISLNNIFTLFVDRAWDHDPQRAESRQRRPDASLLRGQS